jgi:hypothetical protein
MTRDDPPDALDTARAEIQRLTQAQAQRRQQGEHAIDLARRLNTILDQARIYGPAAALRDIARRLQRTLEAVKAAVPPPQELPYDVPPMADRGGVAGPPASRRPAMETQGSTAGDRGPETGGGAEATCPALRAALWKLIEKWRAAAVTAQALYENGDYAFSWYSQARMYRSCADELEATRGAVRPAQEPT